MEGGKRLFLEDVLARTEALISQCEELKALVSGYLETPDEAGESLPESEESLPESEKSLPEPEEDLPEPEEDLPESEEDLPEPVESLQEPVSEDKVPEIPLKEFNVPEPIELEDGIIPVFEKAPRRKAVVDKLASKEAWRTDIPGTKVSDIRSAISLNDRILFINHLFGEDPAAFKEALTALNAMENFNQAADYIASIHPEWNMESDTVYRFMMAVRRRLQ
ncbi:MAG: hypothetical protein SOZ21_07200 [Candidatus Cryptobacteroides sp.]|nr:hypothetical protein [Candidatus Cryptobacteroides sp.]